ncbi:MAG: molybdopterin biosynthesis protein [Gemmataceae bacterium]
MDQDQFLEVLSQQEAQQRFLDVVRPGPLQPESIPLAQALYRVLAEDVVAPIDVPGFDRSNVDGFAVRAEGTFGATEETPVTLSLLPEVVHPGVAPTNSVRQGTAIAIATGAVIPRGANAVIMVEHTEVWREPIGEKRTKDQRDAPRVILTRSLTPGSNITYTGADIGLGETILRQGEFLTSRETGLLAALGIANVPVVRRPRVAILSTGNEIVSVGRPLTPGQIYDSNGTILTDAVRELGGEPVSMGIVADEPQALRTKLQEALTEDLVLLSGGTSKGQSDVSYRVVSDLGEPGIIAHGIALKPGKPLCLAAVRSSADDRIVPVVILPGFPTSAVFTFHEFVADVIRTYAGRGVDQKPTLTATMPARWNSQLGRTEYLLVGLVEDGEPEKGKGGLQQEGVASPSSKSPESDAFAVPDSRSPVSYLAFPLGKGSGSVTSFSKADGFVTIDQHKEYLMPDETVEVHLLDPQLKPADFVVIGSHCVGLDFLVGEMQRRGFRCKFFPVGSTGGLDAVRRGACDLAGVHLLDPKTGIYNVPYVDDSLMLCRGYLRLQGIVFRPDDARFVGRTTDEIIKTVLEDPNCFLVNRNRGSGTRILIDQLLGAQGAQNFAIPAGYSTESKSHNAVCAAIAQGRADWGVAIEPAARHYGLGFLPIQQEQFDFLLSRNRQGRESVRAFVALLKEPSVRAAVEKLGFSFEG